MKIFKTLGGKIAVIGIFVVFSLGFMGTLLVGAGYNIPPFTHDPAYNVSFDTDNVGNLVKASKVQIAGVAAGQVESVSQHSGRAHVTIGLNDDVAPLHEGVTVRLADRSLGGETFVDVRDGASRAIPSGAKLAGSAVRPRVELQDVLRSLDPQTRTSLGQLVRGLGESTGGSRQEISNVMTGLGDMGREGYTAIDAIANQSHDLKALTREASVTLSALNAGEGQIGTLVGNAQRLTSATSGQAGSLRATMRRLPRVLTTAKSASKSLGTLSHSLTPVAADLRAAAPDLDVALRQLPQTASDLRGLLPNLDGTLRNSPATLQRVPRLADDAADLIPQLRNTMSILNPMLEYVKPYGADLAAFVANFNAILNRTDEAGINYIALQPTVNEQVPKGIPLRLPTLLTYKNAYPSPGQSAHPGAGSGKFPRLQRQPR